MNHRRYLTNRTKIYLLAGIILSATMMMSCRLLSLMVPTQVPASVEPIENPALPTPTAVPPTEAPAPEPPAGFIEYQDSKAGISIYIPESWTKSNILEGEYAIFTSYPEEKYIGGEALESGDSKCDLSIRQDGDSVDELIQMWKSDGMTTILSEQEVMLNSGQSGYRFELDSMGRANVLITEIHGRVVLLTCFGDFSLFDEIALTLKSFE